MYCLYNDKPTAAFLQHHKTGHSSQAFYYNFENLVRSMWSLSSTKSNKVLCRLIRILLQSC